MTEQSQTTEAILEPDLPIIDPHHHLWDWSLVPRHAPDGHSFSDILARYPRYLFDELRADAAAGHNIIGTVYMECGAFYRAEGPREMAPVGEVEFVNGVAAMAASGVYGPFRACQGIVGHADLLLGERVTGTLEAEITAGGGRFAGIRHAAASDADPAVLGPLHGRPAGMYADSQFRAGFAQLGELGLSFDAWVLEPQLGDVLALAKAFPQTSIVIDHVGTPIGIGAYKGRLDERFPIWRASMVALAALPNVFVKLGGLAMPFCGFDCMDGRVRPGSEAMAAAWKPYIETCVEAFGANRCMFESNFPVDGWGCDYATLWNAFKRLAAGASADEKAMLFAGTAQKVYRLG